MIRLVDKTPWAPDCLVMADGSVLDINCVALALDDDMITAVVTTATYIQRARYNELGLPLERGSRAFRLHKALQRMRENRGRYYR